MEAKQCFRCGRLIPAWHGEMLDVPELHSPKCEFSRKAAASCK